MARYVGLRYVPVIDGEWTNTKAYEPLTIVTHQGNSYTSKTFVPIGADISNAAYWVVSGNYNAQVELYRQEVLGYSDAIKESVNYVSVKTYGVLGDGVSDDTTAIQQCLDENNMVYFPNGVYRVNGLKIRSNTMLLGNKAELFNISDNVTFTGKSDGTIGGYAALNNITIDGFIFNSDRNRTITYIGIAHAKNITIQNCEFKNDASWHLIELNAVQNGKIINNYFHSYYGGGTSEMVQLDFMGAENYFPWYGPWDNTVCDSIFIENNLFDNIAGKDSGSTILVGTGIGNHSDGAAPTNVIIKNNIFKNLEYGINFSTIKDSVIQDNIFDTVREGIKLAKCYNNTIANNSIKCVQLGGNQYRGIRAVGSDGSTKILNNKVSGAESYCITCEGLNNIVAGNMCDITGSMGGFYIGFREANGEYRNNSEVGERTYSSRASCYVNLVYETEYENVAKNIKLLNNSFYSVQIDNPLAGNAIHSIIVANNTILKADYMTENKTKGNTTWINNIVANAISENFNTNV